MSSCLSLYHSFSAHLLSLQLVARMECDTTSDGEPSDDGACTSAGGANPLPTAMGQRSSASNRICKRTTLAVVRDFHSVSGLRRLVSTRTPGPIVDEIVIFL